MVTRDDVVKATDFTVVSLLGRGDVGKVYLVRYKATGRLYAMKVMSKLDVLRRNRVHRLETEWKVMCAHDHPFVTKLHWAFQSRTKFYLVMEYCEGGEFFRFLQAQKDGRLGEAAAKFYAAEVLLALEYLHFSGVVYRDLKPENILLNAAGHVLLADFDLSHQTRSTLRVVGQNGDTNNFTTTQDAEEVNEASGGGVGVSLSSTHSALSSSVSSVPSSTTSPPTASLPPAKNVKMNGKTVHLNIVADAEHGCSSFVGTAEYIPPEIISKNDRGAGPAEVHAIDWWGFGVLLYEMLYGRTPFRGNSETETFQNIAQQREVHAANGGKIFFPSNPAVSDTAKKLIRALLHPIPELRLGCSRGSSEIREHKWFKGTQFPLIRNKTPPLQPLSPPRCKVFGKKSAPISAVLSSGLPCSTGEGSGSACCKRSYEGVLSDSEPQSFIDDPEVREILLERRRKGRKTTSSSRSAVRISPYTHPAQYTAESSIEDPFVNLVYYASEQQTSRKYASPTPRDKGEEKEGPNEGCVGFGCAAEQDKEQSEMECEKEPDNNSEDREGVNGGEDQEGEGEVQGEAEVVSTAAGKNGGNVKSLSHRLKSALFG